MADSDVGSLVVRIEANLRDFETGMNNVTSRVDGFGNTVKKLGGIIAGAFAVKAIGSFFKSTIEDAAEAEDNLSQLNNVIESTGGKAGVTAQQVTDLAASLQSTTKFSDDAIIAGDNLLLTFTSIGKDVFPAATETMLNMSQALGQDIKGSAIQLGKALNDPIKGITALSRVGVSFTDAQKDQIKALQESGDMMGAQKVILAELNTEFGNAAVAAGQTFSGKLERVKNQFGEIKESIGGALLPVLSNMAEWFIGKMPAIQETVSTAFTNISDFIKPIYETVMPLLQQGFQYFTDNIIPLFSEKIGEASNTVLPLIMDALKNLADTVLPPLQRIFEVFINDVLPKLADAYMNWIKNVYPVLVEAINFIVDNVLPPLIKVFEFIATEVIPQLADKFQEWMPKIVEIVQGLWNGIKPILDLIVKAFEFAWPLIKTVVSTVIDRITGIIDALLKIFGGLIDFIGGVFTGDWERAWNGIKDIFSGIFDGLTSILKGSINIIIDGINFLIKKVNGISIDLPDWAEKLSGMSSLSFNIPEIPKFEKGTNFLPFDTMAFLHKGEAVVPANNNPSNPNANNPVGQTVNYDGLFNGATINVRSDNDIKMIAREVYNLQQSRARGNGVVFG
jgi:phage-related protein